MSKTFRTLKLVCLLAVVVYALATGWAAYAQRIQFEPTLLKALRYRLIGPFNGGRVLTVQGVRGNPNVYYFGAVGGGVWKTTDGGLNWAPIFDDQPVSSIGSIAVSPPDPNVIYVGTGEACIRNDISHGDGVYKSLDAGRTWRNMGLKDTRYIARVVAHPTNPDIAFVAALGHAYGANEERGIFRSTDGGRSWQKVLYKDARTGASDVAFDPSNPNIVFAALWDAYRTPYNVSSGGPGSGLYRSKDGGTTWEHLVGHGLPGGILGRIGVVVAPSNSDRVYALIEALQGAGLYRSDDGGDTWRLINDDSEVRQRPFYYMHLTADPTNADVIYSMNLDFLKSIDGGRTFKAIPQAHGDNHALWIDPDNPQRMINGTDGGACVTTNGGETWTEADIAISQFYHAHVDNRTPYYVYGAMQDDGTAAVPSNSLNGRGITVRDWYPVGGGESGWVVPDTKDPNIVYAGGQRGLLTRYDHRTKELQAINPWPDYHIGWAAADLKYRFQRSAPTATSPHDPKVLYHGANVLFKTIDGGKSWDIISPDLTRNDRSKQGPAGGPITGDNSGTEYYCTIFTLAESPRQKDLIWVGTDDGLIHVTTDGGKNWTNVTPKEMPEWSRISMVEPSPHDAATMYVAVDRHELDDYGPYAYRTNDYGKTWRRITDGIPGNTYVRVVREDPARRGLLYAGTETGIFTSFDDGVSWQSLQLNLPTSPVYDLVVKDNDLVVATHGRSFWILDDLTPLHQLTAEVATEAAHLYKPRPAYRMRIEGGRREQSSGENPPAGALIRYQLKSPKDLTLKIVDIKGQEVRTFSSKAGQLQNSAELNSVVWDLRYPDAQRLPGATLWARGGEVGPLALPGRYEIRLAVDGQTLTAPLEIKPDPRFSTSQEDLTAQFRLLLELRDRISLAHQAVLQIRDIKTQISRVVQRAGKGPDTASIVQAAHDLESKLTSVELAIHESRAKSQEDLLHYPIRIDDRLANLVTMISGSQTAPTKQTFEVAQMLGSELEAQLTKLKNILASDLAGLNDQIRKQSIPPIGVTAIGGERN